MARDIMYYFDKKSPYARYELGEIQTGFNMSQVIDGTKDSMQVQVFNYNENVVEPNTILFHNATQTWWIVKKDNVKRYANENGFYYKHNLTLLGAIDLLNSRDLTDCGFNDKTYTIEQFIKRLFELSTFEFERVSIDFGNNVDKDKVVDYIKSFENYTLLSALREFLNGYNCDAKLSFTLYSDRNEINWAVIKIIPKTGNIDLPILDIDVFDDIRESKNIDKESYGTTAISNAQNVVSTLTKTYPQIGAVNLSGSDYNIKPSSAFLKLPSPIYKVNWLKLYHSVKLYITVSHSMASTTFVHYFTFPTTLDEDDMDQVYDSLARQIATDFNTFSGSYTPVYNKVMTYKQKVYDFVKLAGCITLKTGWKMNPKTATYIAPENDSTFYFPRITKEKRATTPELQNALLLLGSKDDYQCATYKQRCIYYERGSDKIENFNWTSEAGSSYTANDVVTHLSSYEGTDLRKTSAGVSISFSYGNGSATIILCPLGVAIGTNETGAYYFNVPNITCQVNYVPMSDIKIKQDNKNNNLDSKLYNQNGKLNDSVALSKLLDTYTKEIQSETLTRYMQYTNYNDIPKIGQLVEYGTYKYVINNISYDIVPNETNNVDNVGYYFECEFTLAPWVSTKSIMTNPNSNIRDYGIPQKYNIKRRQTYRDYFEFSLTQDIDANQDDPYVSLNNYLAFDNTTIATEYDHTAIMRLTYNDLVGGSNEWFYQLNTTAYVLDKSIYEIVDFGDNNIIGYDMQNATSGFIMNDLFNTIYRSINTPISYTDESGKVKGIYLAMVNKDNLLNLYNQLKGDRSYTNLVRHVFVGNEFYYGVEQTYTVSNYTSYATDESDMIDNQTTVIVQINFNNTLTDANFDFDLSFSNPTLEYPIGSGTMLTGVSIYNVRKVNRTTYELTVIDSNSSIHATVFSTPALDLSFDVAYKVDGTGARANADYNIDEPNYKKDAIEVPVFNYSLQLGDTEQVEIGGNIFNIENRVFDLYRYVIRNRFTTTKLNASKYFDNLSINGSAGSSEYFYNITSSTSVAITYEQDNTIMRIKFYSSQLASVNGNADQSIFTLDTITNGSQISKSNLIGKDIVIYKSMIKSMNYDTNQNTTTCDYDNELMFIIHNPQDSNFDGDDLLVNVNYYKLK